VPFLGHPNGRRLPEAGLLGNLAENLREILNEEGCVAGIILVPGDGQGGLLCQRTG
jgi:hypothetical protein